MSIGTSQPRRGGIVPRLLAASGLQAQTLFCKAALLFIMARALPIEDVGIFGLTVGTLSLAICAVGLEFTTFSRRDVIAGATEEVPRKVRDQLVLHLLGYAIICPALAGVFGTRLLPPGVLPWFFPLLVADHLGQELQRLLVTLGRATSAAFALFVRHGAWVYALAVLFLKAPELITLDVVLGFWLLGEVAALALGALWLRGLAWHEALRRPVDWHWLGRGVRVASPFAVGTLAILVMSTLDRYSVRWFVGEEASGVYVFYLSVRSAIQSLLEVGVVPLFQTRILLAGHRGDLHEYRRLFRDLSAIVVIAGFALAGGAALMIGPLIRVTGKSAYASHLDAYGLILLLPVVQTLVALIQLALYSRRLDRPILASSLVGLIASAALNAALVPVFGLAGAALASISALSAAGGVGWAFLPGTETPCASPSS